MRIISGTAKGRKLFTPPSHHRDIRPTSDRAREALFSILGKAIAGANVLDLFAGTGAIGLEAFSRDADLVVFVDKDRLAIELIKKNIGLCFRRYDDQRGILVVEHDLTRNFSLLSLPKRYQVGYNFIFADPPYESTLSTSILDFVTAGNLLADDGMLIIEERRSLSLPDRFSHLCLVEKRAYGENGFWLYKASG